MHRWSPVVLAQETSAMLLLVHTVAIVLFLCVSLILLKALFLLHRTGERPAGLLAVVTLIFLTCLTRAVWLGIFWLALPLPSWLDLVSIYLVYASAMSTPIILSALYLPIKSEYRRCSNVHSFLHWVMVLNAAAGALVMLVAVARGSHTLILMGTPITYTVGAVLLCARASTLRGLSVLRRGLLLFAAFTSAGLLTVASVLTYGLLYGVLVRRSACAATLLEFSYLLIVIGMVFLFADLRIADVIVKRVLRLALWSCTALCVWMGMELFAQSLSVGAGVRAEAFRNLLSVALIAAFGAATPVGLRLLDLWIDRWIFQQPDFDAAVTRLWRGIIHQKSTADVLNVAAEMTREMLSLASARVVSMREWESTSAVHVTEPRPHFLQFGGSKDEQTSVSTSVIMPLFVEGSPVYYLVLRRGLMRPQLTAMELTFVERVAGQVQVRLETMLAEERRIEDIRRETAFREEFRDAELRALRAQINPHFLFNSLNTIADLTATAPERAEQMTLRLSAVFRYVLLNSDKQFASLREELDFARSYLEIEEFRFGDRLRTLFEIDPNLLERRVPTLLLQPLIENALKHGLAPRRSGGCISIVARRAAEGIILMVADDGVGLRTGTDRTSSASTHAGLSNIRKRLATAYQGFASFHLNPREGGGAEAIVVIAKGLESL